MCVCVCVCVCVVYCTADGSTGQLVGLLGSWWVYWAAGGSTGQLVGLLGSWWVYWAAGGSTGQLVGLLGSWWVYCFGFKGSTDTAVGLLRNALEGLLSTCMASKFTATLWFRYVYNVYNTPGGEGGCVCRWVVL